MPYIIIDKTNDRVINPIEMGKFNKGAHINSEVDAHDIAEHLSLTYPNTHFDVLPIINLVWSKEGF